MEFPMDMEKITILTEVSTKGALSMASLMDMGVLLCQMETITKEKLNLVEQMDLELTKQILLHTKEILKTMSDMAKARKKAKGIYLVDSTSMDRRSQDYINITATFTKGILLMGFSMVKAS
jgi:hypothetical protein